MKKNLGFESVNNTEKEVVDAEYIDKDFSKEDISQPTSPLKAIKIHCLECCGYQYAEVRNCPCTSCFLYPFRNGKNPFRTHNLTEEQKIQARDRLANARKEKKEKEKETK